MTFEEIQAQALGLDMADRARLVKQLLASMDNLNRAELDALWADEAERRSVELDADRSLGRSADDVFRDLLAKLRQTS